MGEWKERGRAMWERFDKRQRYIMLGSALAILVLIFGMSFWYGSKPDMVPLFTDMETKDAGEVASQLRESKISYEIQENKSGTTILVPTTNVHEARLNLATQGLPRGGDGAGSDARTDRGWYARRQSYGRGTDSGRAGAA